MGPSNRRSFSPCLFFRFPVQKKFKHLVLCRCHILVTRLGPHSSRRQDRNSTIRYRGGPLEIERIKSQTWSLLPDLLATCTHHPPIHLYGSTLTRPAPITSAPFLHSFLQLLLCSRSRCSLYIPHICALQNEANGWGRRICL
jgi:hypothetical protein